MKLRLCAGTICVVGLALYPVAVVRAQAGAVVVHDLPAISGRSVGNNTAIMKPIVTDSGSIMFAELSPEWRQRPHHHEQEQVLLVLSGTLDVSIGDRTQSLGPMHVAIPPSNVPHNMNNNSGKPVKVVEYQPVARRDWLGQPPAPPSQNSQPLHGGRTVIGDLSSTSEGWKPATDGARSKSFAGEKIRVDIWELPTAKASARLGRANASGRRFLYMLEGESRLSSTEASRTVARDSVVEMSGDAVNVHATGTGRAMFVIFEMLTR